MYAINNNDHKREVLIYDHLGMYYFIKNEI